MASTQLRSTLEVILAADYLMTDKEVNQQKIKDQLRYTNLAGVLKNGSGTGSANLIYYDQFRLINSTQYFSLDGGLTDVFGNVLDYAAVKIIVLKNLETAAQRFMDVRFKDERYYIGPGGGRCLFEPHGKGLMAYQSSGADIEGTLTVNTNADVTYDIFIIGSTAESSSSSGI